MKTPPVNKKRVSKVFWKKIIWNKNDIYQWPQFVQTHLWCLARHLFCSFGNCCKWQQASIGHSIFYIFSSSTILFSINFVLKKTRQQTNVNNWFVRIRFACVQEQMSAAMAATIKETGKRLLWSFYCGKMLTPHCIVFV